MRIAVAVFLLLHGLAHLVGFLVPWGLMPAPAPGSAPPPPANVLFAGRITLGDPSARAFAVLWLLAAVAFAIVAIGFWRQSTWSLWTLVVVSIVSLALTAAWWPTARIGAAINLAILVSVVVTAVLAYRKDLRVAHAESLSGSMMIDTRAGPIEYATLGEGVPVLALHGTGGGWDQGIAGARGITAHGFRIIAPSRFGYLRTPIPAHATPQSEADALAALLDALGLDRVVVMSFSAGTAPAVAFALRYPDRISKLVLFVPAAGGMIDEKAAGPPAFVLNTVLKWDFPFWAAMHIWPNTMYNVVGVPASLVPALSLEERAELDGTISRILPVSTRRGGMMYDGAFQLSQHRYPLEQITAPTLLISSADDLYMTLRVAKHAANLIPHARLIEFDSGGHLLLGRADEVWPAVAAFLQDSGDTAARTAMRRIVQPARLQDETASTPSRSGQSVAFDTGRPYRR